ncbi:4-hydroxy-3-methylbut-2-enyl diphosphate reductase [Arenicellales bacterium IMCC57338]|nr:4-hydroxy-3-methylbut-2-enyl diphosphate reductase [Gammaproteobacteria bacterium]
MVKSEENKAVSHFNIQLANPRGFCAGVDRAIEIVERALSIIGAPVYVRHEVVHNRFVVDDLREKGAVFVQELDEVPDGSTVIFSAHGVSREVKETAKKRKLHVFDATCPLVTKVHSEVIQYGRQDKTVILVGHSGHPEVEGTMGQATGDVLLVETVEDVARLEVTDDTSLAFVTQTTLSVDDTSQILGALRKRFPLIEGPKRDDICYATQNRQDAVRELATICDAILVVGSANSSNSNRLRELAEQEGAKSVLVDGADDIDSSWVLSAKTVGVTAGASAPEVLVKDVIAKLTDLGGVVQGGTHPADEGISFSLPVELRNSR